MNTTVHYSEPVLIAEMRQKSSAAFQYLYEKYKGAVKTVILQVVNDDTISDDILQQVFVAYWQKIDMYDSSKGRLFTWMLNIARNASIDYLRSKAHKISQKNVSTDNIVYSERVSVSHNIDTIGLQKYVNLLKPEWKEVVVASYFNGNTHEEIAENLGIPLGTIKTRLRAALIELRKTMGVN